MEGIWEMGLQVEWYIIQAAQGVIPDVNHFTVPHVTPPGKCSSIGMPPPEIGTYADHLSNPLRITGTREQIRARVVAFQQRIWRLIAWTQKAKEKCRAIGASSGWSWAEDPVAPPAYLTRPSWSLDDQVDNKCWTLLDILRIRDRPPIRYPPINENVSRLLFEKAAVDVKETHVVNCPTPPLFSAPSSSGSDEEIPYAIRTFRTHNIVVPIPSNSESSSGSEDSSHFRFKRSFDSIDEGLPLKKATLVPKREFDEEDTISMMQVSDYSLDSLTTLELQGHLPSLGRWSR